MPYDHDDDSTMYSDFEGYDSDSSSVLVPFPSYHRQENAPRLRLDENEASKPVYEAWNFYFFPERQETFGGKTVLGIKIQEYDNFESRVSLSSRPSEQSELAEEHLRAIKEHRDKNCRGWAGKLILGKGITYDEDLNQRCEKLPEHVKQALTGLLLDKGRATSTRFRTRAWRVVSMREQFFFRFSGNDFPEAKNQPAKKTSSTPMVFSFIIQGGETKVSTTADGVTTSDAWSNPWATADRKEILNKSRERSHRRTDRHAKSFEFESPPSYRSSSPPPRSPHSRFVSPPSHETRSYRARARSVSPEPVRIRVQRRNRSQDSISDYRPSPFGRDSYAAPTPPKSFTPPPHVSAFGLPPPRAENAVEQDLFNWDGYSGFFPAPSQLTSFPNPPPPPVTYYRRQTMAEEQDPVFSSFHERRAPFGGVPIRPAYTPVPPPPPPPLEYVPRVARACAACKTTLPCYHYSEAVYCMRTVISAPNGISTHPPCQHCIRETGAPPLPPPRLAPCWGEVDNENAIRAYQEMYPGLFKIMRPFRPCPPAVDEDNLDSWVNVTHHEAGDEATLPAELPPAPRPNPPSPWSDRFHTLPPPHPTTARRPPPPRWHRPTVEDPMNQFDDDDSNVSDVGSGTL